ncbi:MAG: hypothetical protein DRQ55_02510 [Planctomycetota bacterium]|nr:MAG: hypothetical protein DRQ55_02510 [Planctomycetota bacterium]
MNMNGCVLGVLCALAWPAMGQSAATSSDGSLAFIPNGGQWPRAVRSSVCAGPLTAWFVQDGWVLSTWQPDGGPRSDGEQPRDGELLDQSEHWAFNLAPMSGQPADGPGLELGPDGRAVAVRLRFLGADLEAALLPELQRPGLHHDLRGADASRWASNLSSSTRQRWVSAYPGIDIVTFGDQGRLRYDLQLQPGAELSTVAVAVEGALGLSIGEDGALLIETELGLLRQPAPTTWNERLDGSTWPVSCSFRLLGHAVFGFAAPDADPDAALVVDPTLEWATFLGGGSIDYVFDSALDDSGRLVTTGFTSSMDYPTTLGAYDVSISGSRDVFVTALEPDGSTLAFSTFLGGFGNDEGRTIDVAADGRVLVGGLTASTNYPVLNAGFGSSFAGGGGLTFSDGFVSVLSADGSTLLVSAYLGGSADDYITSVSFGPDSVHFAGITSSADLPVTPAAFDSTYGGGPGAGDGFFGSLDGDGTQIESLSYLGGSLDDVLNAVLVDPDGRVTVAGWSASADYPTSPWALQASKGGFADAVVSSFDADGALLFSSFLGGESDDNALDVARDVQGRLVLGGTTRSSSFPVTAQAVDSTQGGGFFVGDGFVAVLSLDGRALSFSSYMGGMADDAVNRVRPLDDGLLAVLGQSASSNLSVTPDALDATLGGNLDAVLALYDPAAGELLFASYIGGSEADRAWDLQVDGGAVVMAGYTTSFDLPVTAGAFDEVYGGGSGLATDGWAARVDLGLLSAQSGTVTDLGFAVSGSVGMPHMENAGSLAPYVGGELILTEALPLATGIFVLSGDAGYYPTHGGVLVPYPVLLTTAYSTDAFGGVAFPYRNPGQIPTGTAFYAQAWVLDAAGPKGWSASNALEAVVP